MDNSLKTYTLEEVKKELIDNNKLYEIKLQIEIVLETAKSLPPQQAGHFLIQQLTKILNETDKI